MGSRDIGWTILCSTSWWVPPRPRALESTQLHLWVLSEEQSIAVIHIHISCILEPCKRQGLSVLDGKEDKDLHLQNCQQLAKLQVWYRGVGPLQRNTQT